MKYHSLLKSASILTVMLSLPACASLDGAWADFKQDFKSGSVTTPAEMSRAVYIFDEPTEVLEIVEPAPISNFIMPGQMKTRPASVEMFDQPYRSPFQAVSYANRSAAVEPDASNYLNAIQIYPYTPGSLYQVYSAPQQVTDIALERGEELTSVSAGDTIRWIVGDTVSGQGVAEQVHVLVKPTAASLATNLVITTTKRTYYLELHSYKDTYMAAVSWRYPRDGIVRKSFTSSAKKSKSPITTANITPNLENLQFDYTIKGDSPSWRPVRAFDDGKRVFIQFPDGFDRAEAPPLFVTGRKGKTRLVNYRVKGNYYVVDRLFDSAELRIGEKEQIIVRIIRTEKRA